MLQNLIVSFEAVAPIFLLLALGYGIKKFDLLDEDCVRKLNKLLFQIFFPCVVFYSLYDKSIEAVFDIRLVLYSVMMGLLLWILTIPAVKRIEQDPASGGAMVQGINRSNFLVVGIPILNNVFGEAGMAAASVGIVGMLLVNNVMSVVVLELFRGRQTNFMHLAREISVNPIILATVAGTVFMVMQVKLPSVLAATVISVKNTATPLALIAMGAAIDFQHVGERKRNLFLCIIGKLFLIPGIVLAGGVMMGFRGVTLGILLAFFGPSPTTTSYTMADQMGSDRDLARDCVVFSSALVAVSMFCWIFLLKSIGLF